jgi:hypothetical protein
MKIKPYMISSKADFSKLMRDQRTKLIQLKKQAKKEVMPVLLFCLP